MRSEVKTEEESEKAREEKLEINEVNKRKQARGGYNLNE